ncbi:hypothetical protein [Corynebacterium sp. HMSC078H07]|uniref:hypothetical protein n=1 Tax=Corynebacterium sp. HMSC078H07 TaxID=1739379 RepID=UPI0008A1D70A|nr:hypothetical protein [Corynebacterium sp. HMSC078H07]OFR62988.1 hypothetical protein HMPREF2875_03430 [Corynebacterium sp. HMSC078H07]
MSLNLSLDLKDATLADLEAFLAAARAADSDPHAALSVDGTVMRVDVDKPRVRPVEPQKDTQQRSHFDRPVAENTIRSIIDALSERLDRPYPPRGSSFGTFDPDTD